MQEVDEFIDEVMHSLTEYSGRLEAAAAHVAQLEAASAANAGAAEQSEAAAQQIAAAAAEAAQWQARAAQAEAGAQQASAELAGLQAQLDTARTQLEAARESHIRQQAQIVALQEEASHLRGLVEEVRSAPRPPEEIAQAVEVLAAAQRTAEEVRRAADEAAAQMRADVDAERSAALAEFHAEADSVRARLVRLGEIETDFRDRLKEMASQILDQASGDLVVSLPDDAADTGWIPPVPEPVVAEVDAESGAAPGQFAAPVEQLHGEEAGEAAAVGYGAPSDTDNAAQADPAAEFGAWRGDYGSWSDDAPTESGAEQPEVVPSDPYGSSEDASSPRWGSEPDAPPTWGAPGTF